MLHFVMMIQLHWKGWYIVWLTFIVWEWGTVSLVLQW